MHPTTKLTPEQCIKPREVTIGLVTVYPFLPSVIRWCAGIGMTPNGLTLLAFTWAAIIGALSMWYLPTTKWAILVMLQVYVLLDCADGALARYTGRTSKFGALLDQSLDRFADMLIVVGIAFGLQRQGHSPGFVWTASCLYLFGIMQSVLMGNVVSRLSTSTDKASDASLGVLARANQRFKLDTLFFGGDIRFLTLGLSLVAGVTEIYMIGAAVIWCAVLTAKLVLYSFRLR